MLVQDIVLDGQRKTVKESVLAYYDIRDELTVQDSVFKGPLLAIPGSLRKEMMELFMKLTLV